ncbi:adenylosuccinate lyase [Pseudooceanicola lipolyticus]|uniref:Adenylosuccinate lyase n=1 Tax=Pseudooceanicola lipolyticus TaxID=2029104 RepID=A0A2M8J1Y1_9RHOB|nr:chitin-binding domain-containing protein [Pseudooceanicola lipolyticus]PJE36786.1 adenylosuccinate lyase [Pseudooceanicola lipolyticus]
MTLKTALAALTLTLVPAVGFAMCSGHETQAQSCAEGSVWDAASQSCVKQATS